MLDTVHHRGMLRYPDLGDRIFNLVFSDVSVVIKETTLTTSDSIETGSPVEIKIVKVISLSATEITRITRFKDKRKKNDLEGPDILYLLLPGHGSMKFL